MIITRLQVKCSLKLLKNKKGKKFGEEIVILLFDPRRAEMETYKIFMMSKKKVTSLIFFKNVDR